MKLLINEPDRFPHEADTLLREPLELFFGPSIYGTPLNADVVWMRFAPLPLKEFTNLKAIICPATGVDHIKLPRPDIELLSLRGETEFLEDVHATSEFTVGLILAIMRNIDKASQRFVFDRMKFIGSELHGKTVLVVGRGRVGKQVGNILNAFGCLVLYVDKEHDIDASLPMADIVTVHVNLDDSTRGLFNAHMFAKMKRGTYFINTSRGAVVVDNDLIDALNTGRISRAAIDVFDHQRPPMHPKLLLTPHIAGCTDVSMSKCEIFLAKRLVEWKNNPRMPATSCEAANARQPRDHETVLQRVSEGNQV